MCVCVGTGAAAGRKRIHLHAERRHAARALEQARVAVYPIDVRGVVVLGAPVLPSPNTALLNKPDSYQAPPTDTSVKLSGQYDEMEQKLETAKETGNMKSNKKKTKGSVAAAGGESVEDIQRVMDRQQFHLAQIELIKESIPIFTQVRLD